MYAIQIFLFYRCIQFLSYYNWSDVILKKSSKPCEVDTKINNELVYKLITKRIIKISTEKVLF